jgi:oxygen-dependent protoporphyrinogen oxidase
MSAGARKIVAATPSRYAGGVGSSDVEVAVLGAGVAGLAAALELRAAGAEVAVLEAGTTPGGVLSTERLGGYTIERGPNLFRVPAAADAFLARHELADRLVAAGPESGLRSLLVGGRLVAVPGSVAGAIATPLLSARGKLRVLAEPLVPRGDARGESVAEFVARRLGREALERAVAPALVGVYAGDETRLGAEAVFPSLTEYERSRGSITRGALAAALAARRAGGPAPRRGSWSTREGTAGLARAMAERLGAALVLRCAVRGVAKEGAGFAIETDAGVRRTRRVVVALPAWRAADALRPLDTELAAGLASIEYAPLASVALGVDPRAAREPVRGVGFLVPRAEGLDLLGALFPSRVFAGRAPAGRELAAALLGGARWPGAVDAPDDVLLARAHAGLERALGLRAAPELLSVARWPRAVAQPGREHPRLVADLRARAARLGDLRLAGGYLDGVAVCAALLSGARAGGA